jgi:hypothetical protein
MSTNTPTKALVVALRSSLPSSQEWDERELALFALAEAQPPTSTG